MLLPRALSRRLAPLSCPARINLAARQTILAFSSSPVLHRRWLRGLLGRGGDAAAGVSANLFKQDDIPPELRLPLPGDPMSRLGAGIVDMLIAGAAGLCAKTLAYALGGDAVTAVIAAQGTALAVWVLRDALPPDGNRSIGKRLFKLEVALWDGALPSAALAAARNVHFLALPLAQLHPLLEMAWTLVLVFDISSVLFTQDARKLGDYACGTRVVNERPGREGRLRDRDELAEIAELQAEIRELTPAAPAAVVSAHASVKAGPGSTPPAAAPKWFESVQKEVGMTPGLPKAPRPAAPQQPPGASAAEAQTPAPGAPLAGRGSDAEAGAGGAPTSGSPGAAAPQLLARPPSRKK